MKKRYVYIIIFSLTIFAPFVLGLFGLRYERMFLYEKEVFTPKIESMKSFFLKSIEIDDFLSYQLLYKKYFIQYLSRIRMALDFDPNDLLIVGKDQWLFTNRENLTDYTTGVKKQSKVYYEDRNAKFKKISDYFIHQGKEFYLTVAPDKHSIHPEYLPKYLRPYFKFEDIPMDVRLITAQIPSVNLFKPLREKALSGEILYHAHGTHWNARGGYIAYKETMNRISENRPNIVIHTWQPNDFHLVNYSDFGLAANAYLPLVDTTQAIEQTGFPCAIVQDSVILGTRRSMATRNSHLISTTSSGPKLTIIGDSFTERNYKFFACSFSEILLIYHAHGRWDKKTADAFDAEIVLFEFVERYIHKEFTDIFAQ
jgi:hypothetical protein